MSLSDVERDVCDAIESESERLIALASELIAFDTTAREVGDPARDEVALQEHLAARLRDIGAEVDLFEPDAEAMRGRPLVPDGLDFVGRPQLIATKRGAGGGRSWVLNGHIDVVTAEPVAAWTSEPFSPEVRDGKLYGRGACDMKGGVAAMMFAAQALAASGVELAGDLIVATNTDEESSGAGGSALVDRGLTADAGIVPEPSSFDVWLACRGSMTGIVSVPGRPGHAEIEQPDWRRGGPVNAIEKAAVVLEAIASLRREWSTRDGLGHPYVSRPSLLPTLVRGGEWPVTYPAECELTIAVVYVPAQADEHGLGGDVGREVEQWIVRESARDEWLAAHPPSINWRPNGVMPMEIPGTEPIVSAVLDASADVGRPGKPAGLDTWYDGATLTKLGGIPSIAFGPQGRDPEGVSLGHIVDEYVPVDGLVSCAQALAVTAIRFCGAA